MTRTAPQRALTRTGSVVAFDKLTRALYATDASIYQVEPTAVAFPRGAQEAARLFRAAADAAIPIIPRGAGTGLVGGAIGDGLVVDFARHNRSIGRLDVEQRLVRVEAGVVLDQLNAFLKPFGFGFGPDVATSSRATIGGMIANNSSGARAPLYGTTAEHVQSMDLVLTDGQVVTVGPGSQALPAQQELLSGLLERHHAEITRRFPAGLVKRWPGYGLDRALREPHNLSHLIAGSEGTLAGILSAELKIVPLPKEKGLGLLFFHSVGEAMQATVELLGLQPAAVEHIDQVLLDQTRGQRQFKAARDLLGLDHRPSASILLVEFYENVPERLAALTQRKLGWRTLILRGAGEMNLVWSLRKAGLSLLTSRPGPAKPVTCVEDAAVRPDQLPAYVRGLESILKPLQVEVCYYGHAAAGLLHVRPVLNLHCPEGLRQLRHISDQVSALVRQFRGSLAGEHGVGMARTEYLLDHLGPELIEVMRSLKHSFDPQHLLNPGKIIGDGRFAIDRDLRADPRGPLPLPFEPVLAFAAKDSSFMGNLEQCNGCGGCRKQAATMCPTFIATGDEIMSTRGRANTIRAVLEQRTVPSPSPVLSPDLVFALSDCLGCKACTNECPSNVNMTLLKAELMHARQARLGVPWRNRLLSSVDSLGRLGCLVPQWANAALDSPWLRWFLNQSVGLSPQRFLPHYARERFDHWFSKQPRPQSTRPVFLWDDTFVRYHEPSIGQAAVRVLQAAGFRVHLLQGRRCCGRPAFSQGLLPEASRLGRFNLDLVQSATRSTEADPTSASPIPILFLEPSCYSMFAEDYRELKLAGAEETARRCFLFEEFLERVLQTDPEAIRFAPGPDQVAIHVHCHAKAIANPDQLVRLVKRLPGTTVTLLDTGCCGMAGAFGLLSAKRQLSLQIAEPLVQQVREQPADSIVVATGTSCRHQIADLTSRSPLHVAELLAAALPPG